jgi:hypothetical protein
MPAKGKISKLRGSRTRKKRKAKSLRGSRTKFAGILPGQIFRKVEAERFLFEISLTKIRTASTEAGEPQLSSEDGTVTIFACGRAFRIAG